ncbi:MAG: cyclic nucleotide-binding domain-containing protein [Thermoleophilia bacterium]|nr:cyclic nucleotide-binding domain-containing protein [Thermoleophilia bacterium]
MTDEPEISDVPLTPDDPEWPFLHPQGPPEDARPHPGYDLSGSFWGTLGERFGIVSVRPQLAGDVRIRRVGDDSELVQLSTGRVLELAPDEVRIVRCFDGNHTIAEIIAAEISSGAPLRIEPVLQLVERVGRAGLTDAQFADIFHQLETYLTRQAVEMLPRYRQRQPTPVEGEVADVPPAGGDGDVTRSLHMYEQVPWRARTPLLAERAQFLRGVKLLRTLDSWAIGLLAEAAHEETFPAASNVVAEGDLAKRFYIVRSGEINVVRVEDISGSKTETDTRVVEEAHCDEHEHEHEQTEGYSGGRRRVAKLVSGDWFGEVGLLEGARRNATVRVGAMRPAQLYSFDADTFERLISPYLTNYRGRQRIVRRRERLRRFPLFTELDHAALDRVAQAVKEHRVPASTTVFSQGDDGDRFYMVMDGSVGVVRDGVPVAKLTPGDFFGETALLFAPQRTASVISIDDSRLWSIDKATFVDMVREQLLRRHDILPTVMNRL